MKNTKEKTTLKKLALNLGIAARKFTTLADYTKELKRIEFLADIGIFLIMLIQILQEFISVIYLNYLLVFIGITELLLFIFGRALYARLYFKESGNEAANWESTITFHTNFVLSIFIPMVFFFDADIISFAGARLTNVVLLKELLVLFAFLSLPLYKFIKYKLEQLSLSHTTEADSPDAEKNVTKAKTLCYISFLYDMFLVYSIFTLVMGMINKDERLGIFVLGAAITLGYSFSIPLFVTDTKKILQKFFLTLFAVWCLFMLYEQYLMKMDISYDFAPSVYEAGYDLKDGNHLDIYCHFTEDEAGEQLSYYFVFRDANGVILHYAVAEYDFLPNRWREGLFTWYDSSFTTKLPKKDIPKNCLPIELCFLTETVSYSPAFPEVYKDYVLGTKYVYSGFEEHTTDLFILTESGNCWFRNFTMKPATALPEEITELHK